MFSKYDPYFSAQVPVLILAILLSLGLPASAQEQTQRLQGLALPYNVELGGGFMTYPVTAPVGHLRLGYAFFPEIEIALLTGILSSNGLRNESPNALSGYGAFEGRLYTTGLASVWRPFFYLNVGFMSPMPGSLGGPFPYLAGGGGVVWQMGKHVGVTALLETGVYSYVTPRLAFRHNF
ncbi:MAG: hypothetical protein ACO1RX_04575 [Candidatus Sericytochromatia bacterium]